MTDFSKIFIPMFQSYGPCSALPMSFAVITDQSCWSSPSMSLLPILPRQVPKDLKPAPSSVHKHTYLLKITRPHAGEGQTICPGLGQLGVANLARPLIVARSPSSCLCQLTTKSLQDNSTWPICSGDNSLWAREGRARQMVEQTGGQSVEWWQQQQPGLPIFTHPHVHCRHCHHTEL